MSDTSSDQPTSAPDDESTQQPVPVVAPSPTTRWSSSPRTAWASRTASPEAEAGDAGSHHAAKRPTNPADLVEEPAKVMRIGAMIKQPSKRSAGLHWTRRAGPGSPRSTTARSMSSRTGWPRARCRTRPDRPFFSEDAPSDAELRIAQAQLVGWLEGLFHGIQTALVAQQMAAQAQLQQMRAAPGHAPAFPDRAE